MVPNDLGHNLYGLQFGCADWLSEVRGEVWMLGEGRLLIHPGRISSFRLLQQNLPAVSGCCFLLGKRKPEVEKKEWQDKPEFLHQRCNQIVV